MKRTVLVVDDDKIYRQLIQHSLSEVYNVVEAVNGLDALRVLAEIASQRRLDEVSAMFLDVHMPGGHGVVVLKEIHNRYPDLPVIMCSLETTQQTIAECMNLGAVGYFTKPIDPYTLRERLSEIILEEGLPIR